MFQMDRITSWFLTCVGIVLLGAGILVVPSNAFANAGTDCVSSGGCSLFTGTALGNCVAACCAGSSDPDCCSEACTGDMDYTDCMNACLHILSEWRRRLFGLPYLQGVSTNTPQRL
jgi:hypothetical protein